MKHKRLLIKLLCLLLFFSLFPAALAARAVESWFCKEDYLADYDALWSILEDCYPHWGALGRAGINAREVRALNRQELENRLDAGEGFSGFYTSIASVCAALNHFAHLSPVDPGLYLDLLALYQPDNSRHQAWLDAISEPHTTALYEHLGGEQGKLSRMEQTYTTGTSKLYPAQSVGYIAIKSFQSFAIEKDAPIILRFLENTKDYDHIIIDITGNTGGDDRYWIYNLVFPLGGSYAYDQYAFFSKAAAQRLPLTLPGQAVKPINELPPDITFAHPEDKTGLDFYVHLPYTFSLGHAQIKHRAKRWLLVDQQVYSASEQFALFCKATGWATLIGSNTGGDGISPAGPSLVALPATGLLVRFSAAYGLNPDGSCNAETGTPPDVYCQQGESPLWACLRVLEEEGVYVNDIRRDPFIQRRK